RADRVHVPERPPAERGKPEAIHGADVAVASTPQDALVEAAHGLVHHHQHTAVRHVGDGSVAARLNPEHLVYAGIDLLLPLAAPLAVDVEAALVLATAALVGEELLDHGRRRHPRPERAVQDLADLGAHVDAHLVEQREGPDREPEVNDRV